MQGCSTLTQKAREIQAQLEEWVRENDLLSAGERIVFSLRIERTETIVNQDEQDFLGLSVKEFFTKARFLKCGVSAHMAVAGAISCLVDEFHFGGRKDASPVSTMRELLADERFTQPKLLRLANFGPKSLQAVLAVMESVGVEVRKH